MRKQVISVSDGGCQATRITKDLHVNNNLMRRRYPLEEIAVIRRIQNTGLSLNKELVWSVKINSLATWISTPFALRKKAVEIDNDKVAAINILRYKYNTYKIHLCVLI